MELPFPFSKQVYFRPILTPLTAVEMKKGCKGSHEIMSMTRFLFIARKREERWVIAGERRRRGGAGERERGKEVHSWGERGGRVKAGEREGKEGRTGEREGRGGQSWRGRERGKEFQSWGEREGGIIDGREGGS